MANLRNVGVGVVLLFSLSGLVKASIEPDENEVNLLPGYCRHSQVFAERFGNKEQQKLWAAKIGSTFWWIHHYCWGLVHIQRASNARVRPEVRRHNLGKAVAEINFVLERATLDFVLAPELWTRRGETLVKLKDYPGAEQSFRKALDQRKDYWPAYVGLAQAHIDRGDKGSARTVLESGLNAVSEKRMLQRMLRDLGVNN
jgi:hypothetical protein